MFPILTVLLCAVFVEEGGKLRGDRCSLVLQLHDELIYEVSENCLGQAAKVIKEEMETAMTLSVKMPVKVKCGPSWATMKDLTL